MTEVPLPQIAKKRNRSSKYPTTSISESFMELVKCHPSNYSEITIHNYDHMIRKLLTLLCPATVEEFLVQLLSAEETIEKIKGSAFTQSTQGCMIKAIPCIYKILAGTEFTTEEKAPYITSMMLEQSAYLRNATIKKTNERLPLFSDFLEQVKGAYGEDSPEFLLISLYNELTCRDDYSQLLLTPAYKASICSFNYMVVKCGAPCEAIINQHKTSKVHGPLRVTFSPLVSARIKRYINQHKLQYGQYLFPHSKLSGFVSGILTTCGLKGSISTLRKMKVSEFYNDSSHSESEIEELAKSMGHTVNAACAIYYHGNSSPCVSSSSPR